MKTLETERLILCKLKEGDFEAVHSYASSAENVIFMVGGTEQRIANADFH